MANRSLEQLAKQMALEKASDLILVTGYPPMIRVHSVWKGMGTDILDQNECEQLCLSMCSDHHVEIFRETKELDLSYHIDDLRFRVNLHYQIETVAAAMRLIPEIIPSFESLHLPESLLDFCDETSGLVLITGPTGSGKTTSQASMIDYINENQKKHIITVEDPIEYLHSRSKQSVIEQREVGQDTQSFAQSLKHVLRQTPDVILIGEMRDLETVSTAITAAETGHLVISTLHTNDTVQAIDRMIDIFPAEQQGQIRYQLSLVLKGIVSQMLIPRVDKPVVVHNEDC